MRSAQRTDVGRIRLVNEDRAVVHEHAGDYTLAVLADGMGGHQAGDIASQLAIETALQELRSLPSGLSLPECEAYLRLAVQKANRRIFEMAGENEQYAGMGTTIVAALASAEEIIVGHVGDSRAYKLTGSELKQLTEDHSLVNELLRSGQITAAEAEQHPRRNVLTRALGTELHVEPEIACYSWSRGDRLLICSDGLSTLLADREIGEILRSPASLDDQAQRLIEQALAAGGDDNVTVILLDNDDEAETQAEARMMGG